MKKLLFVPIVIFLLTFLLLFQHWRLQKLNTRVKKSFVDITNQVGINANGTSSGVSWGDYDNDGYQDLFIANFYGLDSKLYRNLGNGKFEDVTDKVGIKPYKATAGIFADVDNDGFLDLVVVSYDYKSRPSPKIGEEKNGFKRLGVGDRIAHLILYRNNGHGGFEDVTEKWGLKDVSVTGVGTVAFADINHSGLLDMVVTSYGPAIFYSYTPQNRSDTISDEQIDELITQFEGKKPSAVSSAITKKNVTTFFGVYPGSVQLFKNTGQKFLNMTDKLPPLSTTSRKFYQPIFFDYNGDNLPDLFITVDFDHSIMLQNTGNFNFVDVTEKTGLSETGAWMGVDVADFENNGQMGMYISNRRGDALLQNQNGKFKIKQKLNRESFGWGVSFLDYDNDGWEDVFVCNGETFNTVFIQQQLHELPWDDYTIEHILYKNSQGNFNKVYGELNDKNSCKGSATADFNNDGFEDIFVANELHISKEGSILYENTGNSNSWLKIKLIGKKSNKFGVGAKIQVTANNLTQTKLVTDGNSFSSQSSFEKIFGFGNYKGAVDVTIFWPSGIVQHLKNVRLNNRLVIEED